MSSDNKKLLPFPSLRSRRFAFRATGLAAFALLLFIVLFHGSKKPVELMVNGERSHLYTHASTVGELLAQQGIEASADDIVSPSVNQPITSNMTVEWNSARQIAIRIDGKERSVRSARTRVADILEEAGIRLTDRDKVVPARGEQIGANSIRIHRAFPVRLTVGGKPRTVWTTRTTVRELLATHRIALGAHDRVSRRLKTPLTQKTRLAVTRVKQIQRTVKEPLPFETVRELDRKLKEGDRKVEQKGAPGLVERTYAIVKHNGKVKAKTLIAETVTKEPQERVLKVGAGKRFPEADRTLASRSGVPSEGRELYMEATAYSELCSACTGMTANGMNLWANPGVKVIAVDPSVIRLGSKVWVEGYGYAVAADTGSAIKGNRIDVYIPNEERVNQFGRRMVRMKVLD